MPHLNTWALEGFFQGVATSGFSKTFSTGRAKELKFVFSHLKLRKQPNFDGIF